MRILITGADGQLAKSFIEIHSGGRLYIGTKDKIDVTNRSQVLKVINRFKPDVILHFASLTRGEECAKNPKKAREINVNGTKNVVEAAKRNNSAVLFVSSNEVFGGEKKYSFTEKNKPNPKTVVGRNKHEAEEIIIAELKKYFIVRTSWLYSKWTNNFLHVILNKARKNKVLELVKDEFSSPTYSKDLAYAIRRLISTRKYGIYHINNTGKASRLEFGKKAFEIYQMTNIKIIPVRLNDYDRKSKPPHFTVLNNNKARKIGIIMPRWESALKRFLLENNI